MNVQCKVYIVQDVNDYLPVVGGAAERLSSDDGPQGSKAPGESPKLLPSISFTL